MRVKFLPIILQIVVFSPWLQMSHKCLINVTIVISFPLISQEHWNIKHKSSLTWTKTNWMIAGNILVCVNFKFWSTCIWYDRLDSYLKRTVIPVVILLGNFWPKFLFILCKVHQEKKWRLNSMLKDFDYHSWKLFHENINHDMIIIKHAYTWDIWWSQDW